MKKSFINLYKCYEILYASFLSSGLLIISACLFAQAWPCTVLFFCALTGQVLLIWTKEKKTGIWVCAGMGVLTILYGLFVYRTWERMDRYFFFLGIEGACIAVSFVAFAARHRVWVKLPLMLLQAGALVYFAINKIAVPKWAICMILFCFLLFLAELGDKEFFGKKGRNAICLFPVFLLVMLMFFRLPVKETPIQWNTVKSMARIVNEKINGLLVSAEYFFSGRQGNDTFSFAGYDENGGLGGKLITSDKPQISLKGSRVNKPFYLAGSVYDFYTGTGWERKAQEKPYEKEEYRLGHEQMLSAFSNSIYTREDRKKFIRYGTLQVNHEKIMTKSLFCPFHTYRVNLPEGFGIKAKEADIPALSKARGVGFSYEVKFMQLDYANEMVKNLLRQQAWKEERREIPLNEILMEREVYIKENYTILPDTVPDRVYDLAEEVTKGYENDYDRLKAIEAYLNQYTYTKEPDACPPNQDFTDYFLFEGYSGYCTYFATAMAVLGRCAGIPTRYVEGFVLDSACEVKGNTWYLTGNDSHAWAEAYIDQIGWIPFEATAGYSSNMNQEWIQPEKVSQISSSNLRPTAPSESSNMEIHLEETNNDRKAEKQRVNVIVFFWEVFGAFVLLFGMTEGVLFLRRTLQKKAYTASSNYAKAESQMKRILDFGKRYGMERREEETLLDYECRLSGRLDMPSASFNEICALFQKIRFGQDAAEDEDIHKMEAYTGEVKQELMKKSGRIKRFLYHINQK